MQSAATPKDQGEGKPSITRNFSGTAEEAEVLESSALRFLVESKDWGSRGEKAQEPLRVLITGGDWEVSAKSSDSSTPLQYSLRAAVLVWRDEASGWPQPKFKLFDVTFFTALAAEGGSEVAEKVPPFVSYKIQGEQDGVDVPVESVPQDIYQVMKQRGRVQ